MRRALAALAALCLAASARAETSGIRCPNPGERAGEIAGVVSGQGYTLTARQRGGSIAPLWSLAVAEDLTAEQVAALESALVAEFGQ